MTDLAGKKLPTVEQVEEIIKEWGKYSVEELANRFELENEVIEAAIEYIRKLKRAPSQRDISVMACYRNDQLESIVRCAGAQRGYM